MENLFRLELTWSLGITCIAGISLNERIKTRHSCNEEHPCFRGNREWKRERRERILSSRIDSRIAISLGISKDWKQRDSQRAETADRGCSPGVSHGYAGCWLRTVNQQGRRAGRFGGIVARHASIVAVMRGRRALYPQREIKLADMVRARLPWLQRPAILQPGDLQRWIALADRAGHVHPRARLDIVGKAKRIDFRRTRIERRKNLNTRRRPNSLLARCVCRK